MGPNLNMDNFSGFSHEGSIISRFIKPKWNYMTGLFGLIQGWCLMKSFLEVIKDCLVNKSNTEKYVMSFEPKSFSLLQLQADTRITSTSNLCLYLVIN